MLSVSETWEGEGVAALDASLGQQWLRARSCRASGNHGKARRCGLWSALNVWTVNNRAMTSFLSFLPTYLHICMRLFIHGRLLLVVPLPTLVVTFPNDRHYCSCVSYKAHYRAVHHACIHICIYTTTFFFLRELCMLCLAFTLLSEYAATSSFSYLHLRSALSGNALLCRTDIGLWWLAVVFSWLWCTSLAGSGGQGCCHTPQVMHGRTQRPARRSEPRMMCRLWLATSRRSRQTRWRC